jgi:hypothetical protein
MKVHIFRRYRGSWFRWEWHNHGGVIYLMLSTMHPRKHAWWSTMIYFYLKGGK